MMKVFIILAVMLGARNGHAEEALPVNPAVTQSNIGETICLAGWSHSVRPPVSMTNRVKIALLQEMGLPLELIGDFVLDHRISISAGGSPIARENLILQDRDESLKKDRFESELHHQICAGMISLHDAQSLLWNWSAK